MNKKSRKNCFIKLSGDRIYSEDVIRFIKELNQKYYVVLCVGGGTQIRKALEKAGLPTGKFGILGRKLKEFRQKQVARNALEDNQALIQDFLAGKEIYVSVIVPVLEIGTVLCHINGDEFLRLAYNGFDILYVITAKERIAQKKNWVDQFDDEKKVEVIGF